MKRILLAIQDFRAQARLLLAMARHDDAVKVLAEARAEVDRAGALVVLTGADMDKARADAEMACLRVRRHRQRVAVGLR